MKQQPKAANVKTAFFACMAALAVAAVAGAAARPGFQGPLEMAAQKSALAARSPMNALARVGTRLVAAGQRGHILHSGDGRTWTQADVPVSADLNAVHFPTAAHGWAVGHEGVVLHSADAGASWQRQLDGRQISALVAAAGNQAADGDKPLLDVWFEDPQRGWVVGAFNLILRTEDGGRSWTSWTDRADNPKGMHLYAIRPAGGTLYIVGEQGIVLKLDRQKQRFTQVPLPYQGTLFGVVGNDQMVVVFGLRGNAWRSADGGAAWTKLETGVAAGLSSALVRADGSVLLASQAGHVLHSTDNGVSFRRIPTGSAAPIFAINETVDGAMALAGSSGVRIEAVK